MSSAQVQYDTLGSPYQAEPWYVGKVRDKEKMHKRLLDRGMVGDFVLAESERGGLTLVCKIGEGDNERLSFPHIITAEEQGDKCTGWQVQMEGSKHVLKSIYHLLEHIAPLARVPSRELVVDAPEEDSFVLEQSKSEVIYDVAWGSRTLKHNAGGFFKATDKEAFEAVYDMARGGAGPNGSEADAVYDMARGGARPKEPAAASAAVYDFGGAGELYDPATMAEDPVYAVAAGGDGSQDAVYDVASAVARPKGGKGGQDSAVQDAIYDMASMSVHPKKAADAAVYDVASSSHPAPEYDVARS